MDEDEVMYDGEPYSPEDVLFWDCENVIKAGIWLIQNGYGKMQILPYLSQSGCYWRCEFHPTGRPSKAFFRYSSSSGGRFLADHSGGSVRRTVRPKGLARAIMVSVPECLKNQCSGDMTSETESWVEEIERALSLRWLPQAFHEYKEDNGKWDLVSLHGAPPSSIAPQPGYIKPGTEPNWRHKPFWRSCAAWGNVLREHGPYVVDSAMVDTAVTEEIATETYQAMLDADEYEPQQILQMAMKAVLYRIAADPQNKKLSLPLNGGRE